MSEDNVTALFRASVAVAQSVGEEFAYRSAARFFADLYQEAPTLTIAAIRERLDDARHEMEVRANTARHHHLSVNRRIQRAGMELRDDTTPR